MSIDNDFVIAGQDGEACDPDFRTLFESLPGLYLVLAPDLTIVAASDAYLAATMTTRDGIIGRALFEIFPENPDDPSGGFQSLEQSLRRVLRTGAVDAMPVQKYDIRQPASGAFEERFWSAINAPTFSGRPDGTRVLCYLVHRVEDVTEFVRLKRRQIETQHDHDSLRARAEEMEAEIYSRARQMEESNQRLTETVAELQGARDELARHAAELARSNADLQDFAYIASHDLKEPMRGISTSSGFLIEDYRDRLDEEGRGRLETIVRLSKRMYELLDYLLEFTKAGRSPLRIERIAIEKVLESAMELVSARTDTEDVEFDRDGALPVVNCDPVRTAQAMANLIINGIKYNNSSPKRITIGASPREDREVPVLSIRDNGIGIPERHQARIFQLFKRLHARDAFGGGAGAGLTIARKIIERHGGRIWLESTEGEGSTFYFTLAAGSRAVVPEPRQATLEASALSASQAAGRRKSSTASA